MSDDTTPTLRGFVDSLVSRGLEGMRVSMPGRVEAYDATTQKADVQPLVKRRYTDAAGVEQVERLPVVPSVPVIFPGAGEYSITFPVDIGDVVLLVFADSSLDLWLARGGEVDPEDTRSHALTDAVAIPGLRPFRSAIDGVPSDALVVTGAEVRLGSAAASDPAAGKAALDALKSAISGAAVGVSDGGALFKTNILAALSTWPAAHVATKVKIE